MALGELEGRLASPSMPSFSVAEVLDRGISLIHDGPVDDSPAAFRAIAAKAVVSPDLADLAGVIGATMGSDSLADAVISAKYSALGGAGGLLGPTTAATVASPSGSGWFRQFQNGRTTFDLGVGAHEVHGAILAKWIALGAEGGLMGYPIADQETGQDPAGRGFRQRFQRGEIFTFPDWRQVATGATTAVNAGMLEKTVPALAGPEPLPAAILSETVTATAPLTAARSRRTRAGVLSVESQVAGASALAGVQSVTLSPIYSPPGQATHEVHGAIGAKYDGLGAEGSFLGYPTTDETGCPDGIGRYNHFEAGSIYWSPSTGAHEVHGLIRELWAGQGWERGPLGYPLTDELIPDRRIGHVHPERRRKPIVDMPFDLVKLPEAAGALGFASTVVNTSPAAMAEKRVASLTQSASLAALGGQDVPLADRPQSGQPSALRTAEGASVAPILGAASLASGRLGGTTGIAVEEVGALAGSATIRQLLQQPSSTAAADRSTNRFADFANGVAFWRRGDGAASVLAPWAQAGDGSPTHFSESDVMSAVRDRLYGGFASIPNTLPPSIYFIATTGYSFDGAGVRNRRHRIRVDLTTRPTGIFALTSATASFEVQAEIAFEPVSRDVVALIADWSRVAQSGDFGVDLVRWAHAQLDDLLGTPVNITTINDTDNGAPIAVLSVKTMQNGEVSIYVEPPNPVSHWAVLNEVKVSDVLRGAIVNP